MFTFDGIVFDRIKDAIAENSAGEILYRLTQLSEASIETTSESTEARDAQGVLIKKTYKSKGVTFNATNAMLDLNIVGQTTGSGKELASATNKIEMPRIIVAKVSEGSVKLPVKPIDASSIRFVALTNTGATAPVKYTLSATSTASANEFAYNAGTEDTEAEIIFPTSIDAEYPEVLIKYEYEAVEGVKVEQRADKFPSSVKLTLQALAYDPCTPDVLRHCIVVFPNFQVSPDTTISFTADATLDFSGDAAVDYCSADKQLYYIVMSSDDTE